MTQPTEKQIALIRELTSKIIARPLDPKPTFTKSWNGRKVSSNENIEAAKRVAHDVLAKLEAGQLDSRFASNCISDLMIQVRRARA